MTDKKITIIGGGLAGCEAAHQAVRRGCRVTLHEMKPERFSPAHESEKLAELVCSNSLRSDSPDSAVGLLKNEMRKLDSLLMRFADKYKVPAGKALAVDRSEFSRAVTEYMENEPNITLVRKEVSSLPKKFDQPVILTTGPLTSEKMAESLTNLTGEKRMFFYDAIAPIVFRDSLDFSIIYEKSRWDDGPGDYLNCPFTREEYLHFREELLAGKTVTLKKFEDEKYFEGCLPVEVLNSRGEDTLRFGPMKPVGLRNPATGKDPYAVVQLRKENRESTLYNMVGFQTKLTYPEQKRIFRLIPGMKNVEFARLGSIHRNTFICAPELLEETLQIKKNPQLFIGGQLSGVEGYVESIATGLLCGINCARMVAGKEIIIPPRHTALGSLIFHLTKTEPEIFQPSNINFGLFPQWEKKIPKKMRGQIRAKKSEEAMRSWLDDLDETQKV